MMVPVLSSDAAKIISRLASDEVELIPARFQGEAGEYFVMNVRSVVKCVDEQRTQYVEKWTSPDRAGDYRMLWGITINPAAAEGHNLFRLAGFLQAMIASLAIKEAFEGKELTGVQFHDVCSPREPFKQK